ncbi:unknown [Bacteroides intestinalis CAG:315]|nr:unknown [Bacteroides intestinalis CAG:315]
MESVSNLWKILFEYNIIDYQVDMSVSQMSDTDRK